MSSSPSQATKTKAHRNRSFRTRVTRCDPQLVTRSCSDPSFCPPFFSLCLSLYPFFAARFHIRTSGCVNECDRLLSRLCSRAGTLALEATQLDMESKREQAGTCRYGGRRNSTDDSGYDSLVVDQHAGFALKKTRSAIDDH